MVFFGKFQAIKVDVSDKERCGVIENKTYPTKYLSLFFSINALNAHMKQIKNKEQQ